MYRSFNVIASRFGSGPQVLTAGCSHHGSPDTDREHGRISIACWNICSIDLVNADGLACQARATRPGLVWFLPESWFSWLGREGRRDFVLVLVEVYGDAGAVGEGGSLSPPTRIETLVPGHLHEGHAAMQGTQRPHSIKFFWSGIKSQLGHAAVG